MTILQQQDGRRTEIAGPKPALAVDLQRPHQAYVHARRIMLLPDAILEKPKPGRRLVRQRDQRAVASFRQMHDVERRDAWRIGQPSDRSAHDLPQAGMIEELRPVLARAPVVLDVGGAAELANVVAIGGVYRPRAEAERQPDEAVRIVAYRPEVGLGSGEPQQPCGRETVDPAQAADPDVAVAILDHRPRPV